MIGKIVTKERCSQCKKPLRFDENRGGFFCSEGHPGHPKVLKRLEHRGKGKEFVNMRVRHAHASGHGVQQRPIPAHLLRVLPRRRSRFSYRVRNGLHRSSGLRRRHLHFPGRLPCEARGYVRLIGRLQGQE